MAHSLFLNMTNSVPKMAFHIYAANHGSDICDCVASIDKKAMRNYESEASEKTDDWQGRFDEGSWRFKWRVFPLSFGGIYFSFSFSFSISLSLPHEPPKHQKKKGLIKDIRQLHCFEVNFDSKTTDPKVFIKALTQSDERWKLTTKKSRDSFFVSMDQI